MTRPELAATEIGLEPGSVMAWLERRGAEPAPPLSLVAVGRGKSNITVVATDRSGRRWVLRRPPLGPRLASAHDVAREYRVLSALQGTAVPVPTPLGLAEGPALTDVDVLVLEHVDGLVIADQTTAEDLPTDLRSTAGAALVDALAAIHAVDTDAVGLAGLGPYSPYADRQLRRWTRQWEATRTRQVPSIDRLATRLARALPTPRERTLVHGDVHLSNVIVDPASGTIRAVLDWELATLGEPLADLGCLLAYWAQPDDPPGALFPASLVPGFPTRRDLAQRYALVSGRELDTLGFWYVLALWKTAIICEGVRRRALDDRRNAARGATVPEHAIEALLGRAETAAARHGI